MEINKNYPLENLDRVISRYDVFLHNLRWCKDEKAVDELTLELTRDKEFYNVCRKAKKEIKTIVNNDKKTILEDCFLQYQNIDKIKKEWEKEVREGNKNISRMYITIVNVDLSPINNVFFVLEKQFNVKAPPQNKKIDWLKIFEQINTDEDVKPECYINANENPENYFNKASLNLTLDYLKDFKKETYLFSDSRKLDYINAQNIQRPKTVHTESKLFNQTVFEAKSNFYDFINDYKNILLLNTPKQVEAKKPTGRKKSIEIPLSQSINKDKKEVWKRKKRLFIKKFKDYEGQKLALLVQVLENKGFINKAKGKKQIFTSLCLEFGKEYNVNKNKAFSEYYNKREPQNEDAYSDVEEEFETIF